MKKRIFLILTLVISSFVLSGCGKVIELSDDETKMIAEYAAELLLKYDGNYVERLSDGEESLNETSAENKQNDDEADEPSEITGDTEIDTTENSHNGNELNSNIDSSNEKENYASGSEKNIAKIIGLSGVDITFKDYIVTDHYPATDGDGEFIYLDATDGYQLLVVRFKVINTTDNENEISLIDKEIGYRIVCNESHGADPMLTILMDDLGTLETRLQPGQEIESVLVFQISDSMKDSLESIKLKVNYNNTDNVINILD